jgi:hypothetical protein
VLKVLGSGSLLELGLKPIEIRASSKSLQNRLLDSIGVLAMEGCGVSSNKEYWFSISNP